MKALCKQIVQWGLAIIISAVITNCILLFYNVRPTWITTHKGATTAVYAPNSIVVKMTEGKGFHRTDSRGYVNNSSELADNYIICVGASHTQGKEVNDGERYTDLLNAYMGYTDEVRFYNVGEDAYFLPDVLKGFHALVAAFPDSEAIIIETMSTNYDISKFEDALFAREYDSKDECENIMNNLSPLRRLLIQSNAFCPLYYNLKDKIASIRRLNASMEEQTVSEIDLDYYREVLKKCFDTMVQSYDRPIIILFHPEVELTETGELTIKERSTDQAFKALCEEYPSITLVDMSERFLSEYKDSYTVPYGFSNTTMCEGHLNKDGHRMIADELLEVLDKGDF